MRARAGFALGALALGACTSMTGVDDLTIVDPAASAGSGGTSDGGASGGGPTSGGAAGAAGRAGSAGTAGAAAGASGAPACGGGHLDCGPGVGCVDPRFDREHCGSCTTACTAGLCVVGTCECPATAIACGNDLCVDRKTDRRHCGGCGQTCGPKEQCAGGQCV